jgi:hypothetical protein
MGARNFSEDVYIESGGSLNVSAGATFTCADGVPRAQLAENALAAYPLPLTGWVDATVLPLTTPPAATLFGLSAVGTGVLGIASAEVDSASDTPNMATTFVFPPEYVAGGDVWLTVNCKMTAAATVKTIDVVVNKVDVSAGTVGVDICATAVQTISTSFAAYTFVITSTTLSPGDTIQINVAGAITEAGVAPTTMQISRVKIAFDIKG